MRPHNGHPGLGGSCDRPPPVHRQLEARAARTPGRAALVTAGGQISYRELNRRADRLARLLTLHGAAAETLVGVFGDRSVETVVSLVAVLKAGAACLPLDRRAPPRRLATMLAAARPLVVLTTEALAGRLPASAGEPILVDRLPPDPPGGDLAGDPDPAQLAYVHFTSGSSGAPKAVLTEQGALAHYVADAARAYGLGPGDRVLQFASIGFDASVEEIYPTLASGAALVVAPDLPADPVAFLRRAADLGTTVLNLPTAFWHHLLAEPARLPPLPRSLRLVVIGGEEALAGPLAVWSQRPEVRAGRVRLVNTYGPTEGTVVATRWEAGGRARQAGRVPIGHPIAGVEARLLDASLRPVPPGAVGEICLAGAGLARGYLGRPALTAASFVPDPLGPAGSRLYRTGDLARRLADGCLVFLGRKDRQLKIRGFRVEPGEIEAALRAHPAVRDGVVAPRPVPGGEPRLAAWVVPAPGRRPARRELRDHLRRRLPDYMLPSAWSILDALPRLASGKVDLGALPAPAASDTARRPAAPRPGLERNLAAIWRSLLGVRIAAGDDFFALGGHSLLATRLAGRVRDRLGVDLPLERIFAAPVLERMAAEISRRRGRARPLPPLAPTTGDEPIPLSRSQERVWFVERLDGESLAYNTQDSLRFRGPLRVEALERSLQELVRRHEILRTTFPAVAGRPRQVVHEPWPLRLEVIDLRRHREVERSAAEEQQVHDLVRRRFRVDRLPLVHWTLLRLRDDEHLLVRVEHHLIHDGWSYNLLLAEMVELYRGFAAGGSPELPAPPIQFRDFARWQQSWLEGPEAARQLRFWKRELAGGSDEAALPADRPRPARRTSRGATLTQKLPEALYRRLRELSRGHGVTLFMTMLAAFAALLRRSGGPQDMRIGTAVANRGRPETEGLIGMLVNNLVLRLDLAGDPSFAALLARVRKTSLRAYEHQDLPFEQVVRALAPERSLDRNPLFQVMFSFHDSPLAPLEAPGLELSPRDVLANGTAKFDLNVTVIPRSEQRPGPAGGGPGEGIFLHWEFSTDLFAAETVESMIERYRILLEAALADPERRLSRLPLLPAGEERRVLVDWQGAARSYRWRGGLHRLVAAQAERTPERIAVEAGEARLTYRRLVARARALAARLRRRGVGPETSVGLCAERSPEMVVGLLATLEAGALWLPLDPDHPDARLARLLDDAEPRAVLVQRRFGSRLGGFPAGRRIVLEDALAATGEDPAPGRDALPEQGAYLLYTSGSTGSPKGVVNTHEGICNRLLWMQEHFGLAADDRVLQKTPFGFDVAVWEFFWPLITGARLVLARPGGHRDPAYLIDLIAARRITTLHFVPSMLQAFVEAPGVERCRSLRRVIASGEELPAPLVRRFAERLEAPLFNLYGPTEAAVDVTAWRCQPAAADERVPIGRPVANTRLYVLDEHCGAVPAGVPGELFIGGVQLARGYFRQPGRTAACFVPDPYGPPGARLYRTGDRARWRRDGALEFLGRLDHQVKIRGVRIEPGEIEAALARHPGVGEAAVAVRPDRRGEPRLVGYAVPRPGPGGCPPPTADGLRRWLEERLPAAFVPPDLVLLDGLPRSPHGKLDRGALPDPGLSARSAAGAPPEGPTETVLARIWSRLLGLPRVGRQDDFFRLGGHSLLALRAQSQIARCLGVELPLASFFESSRLDRLARRVDEALAGGTEPAPPLEAVSREHPLPLSSGQRSLWFLDRLEPGNPAYEVSVDFALAGRPDVAALRSALTEIVRRHEVLRTRFVTSEDSPRQVVDGEPRVGFSIRDLSADPPAARARQLRRLLRGEGRARFDLERGPLLRTTLVRMAAERHLLLLRLHHIVADEWSKGLLVRELSTFWRRASGAAIAPPPPLPIQYADFSCWQRRSLSETALARLLRYWTARLEGLPVLRLPTDRPRPAVQTYRGAARRLRLPAAATRALERLAAERGASLYMVLLAALMALLHRVSGQTDLAVGSPAAARPRPELEDLIGFFVDTLVLRQDLSGDPDFAELVGEVRSTVVGALAHRELPFEKLVEKLEPERDPGRHPLFQVLFAFQDAPEAALDVPGVEARRLRLPVRWARFDLEVGLWKAGGGLDGNLIYNADLFEAATAARLAAGFRGLLEAIAAAPDRRLSELPADGLPAPVPPERPTAPRPSRPAEPDAEPPRGGTETALAEIWCQLLELPRVGRHQDFFRSGGHSILAARLMARIERRFGVRVPLSSLFRDPTVAGLARRLEGRPRPSASLLVAIREEGDGPPFFCVHPAGGNVLCYRELAARLEPVRPFYGLRARGCESGERFDPDLGTMAARYVAEVCRLQPAGPYLLGGWSMGGAVALEMAGRLREAGREVALVALIDSVAPPKLPSSDGDELETLRRFALDQGVWPRRLERAWSELRRLPLEAARRRVLREVTVSRDGLRHLYLLFRSNRRALERHAPRPCRAPIVLFRTGGHGRPAPPDDDCGWRPFAPEGLEICPVPGDHLSVVREPHVRILASELGARLWRALERHEYRRPAGSPRGGKTGAGERPDPQ